MAGREAPGAAAREFEGPRGRPLAAKVEVDGLQLVRAGAPFRFAGFNAFALAGDAAKAPVPGMVAGTARVRGLLREAERRGLTALRTFASPPPDEFAAPLVRAASSTALRYSEPTFRALDFVLAEAQQRGIAVLLVLENFWDVSPRGFPPSGAPAFLQWSRGRLDGRAPPAAGGSARRRRRRPRARGGRAGRSPGSPRPSSPSRAPGNSTATTSRPCWAA